MFTVSERVAVRDHLVRRAHDDGRVAACAFVGSTADGEDRWSDIDITCGVAEGSTVVDVLTDWTTYLAAAFGANALFDVAFRTSTYRVFLLPSNLQVDLSFTPAADFAPTGPRFKLLFGVAGPACPPSPRPTEDHLGLAVHHAVRARICIERGRQLQAEYWVSGLRYEALTIACRVHGLEDSHGRGFDRLPMDVAALAAEALVSSLEREEMLRALTAAIDLLKIASGDAPVGLVPQLRELTATRLT